MAEQDSSIVDATAGSETSIQRSRDWADEVPEDHIDRSRRLVNLGFQLKAKYTRTYALEDLEDAIKVTTQAVDSALTPGDRASSLRNLAVLLQYRYSAINSPPDLDKALEVASQLAEISVDNSDPTLELAIVSQGLDARFSSTGAIADLEESIRLTREATSLTPIESPQWGRLMTTLSAQLTQQATVTGDMAQLEKAVEVAKEAVARTSDTHPHRAQMLHNLGCTLAARYDKTGNMKDIEEAIELGRNAVNLTTKNDTNHAKRLGELGQHLGSRYLRTGAMADLDDAIVILTRSKDQTPVQSPLRPRSEARLSDHLSYRYARTKTVADLDEAISLNEGALKRLPKTHIQYPSILNSLGTQYGARYTRTKDIGDLDKAIRVAQEAVDSLPDDHLGKAAALNNLGMQLRASYDRTGAPTDLDEAIKVARMVVRLTDSTDPNTALFLGTLGYWLDDRYSITEQDDDFLAAANCFELALHHPTSRTIDRIKAAIHGLRFCSRWEDAYQRSKFALDLLPQLTIRSFGNSDKQHALGQVVGLASDAAAAALWAEKPPSVALGLLEQGRGVLSASLVEMRMDIEELQKNHPTLAEQFIRLRTELEAAPAIISHAMLDEKPLSALPPPVNRRYDSGKEFDKLVDDIRRLPGLERFMSPPTVPEMQAAAEAGPIVLINTSDWRCDAILVEKNQIRALRLPGLSTEDIEGHAKRGDLGSSRVLGWLWDTIMEPILKTLGFTQPPPGEDWPHVWWIPTGYLCKFPLHAAGYHNRKSNETVLDRVMSSYSSSIGALIHSRRNPVAGNPRPARGMLVGMEHTPEYNTLRFAKQEIILLREVFKSMGLDAIEPDARKQDVMSQLRGCGVFHFAGHGYTNVNDPSKSHLLLKDWKQDPLQVADLLQLNLGECSPFLAYLSACGTGRVDDMRFFDENIHLINAFQLAGFRHVVGTLWDVDDAICVDVAKITYEGIKEGGLSDGSVCRGLHQACRELRDRMGGAPRRGGDEDGSSDGSEGSWSDDDEDSAGSDDEGGEEEENTARKITLASSDDGDSEKDWPMGALPWVAYVHFGP